MGVVCGLRFRQLSSRELQNSASILVLKLEVNSASPLPGPKPPPAILPTLHDLGSQRWCEFAEAAEAKA